MDHRWLSLKSHELGEEGVGSSGESGVVNRNVTRERLIRESLVNGA